MNIAAWQAQLPTIATVLTVLVGLLTVGRKVWPWARKVSHLIDDFMGEEERPGQPARPGIMRRLENVEDQLGNVETRLAKVEHELTPNGGSSTRDVILRRLEELTAQVSRIESHHTE